MTKRVWEERNDRCPTALTGGWASTKGGLIAEAGFHVEAALVSPGGGRQ